MNSNMADGIDWLFNDPVPCVELASRETPLKTEVKSEAGWEGQLHDGSDLGWEVRVKGEVQVKGDQGDQASVMQGLCVSSPGGCGACVLSCDRAEASSEVECDGVEKEQYMCKRDAKGNWHVIPYVKVKREPETFGRLLLLGAG